MGTCLTCSKANKCLIKWEEYLSSEGTGGVVYPNVEKTMLSIIQGCSLVDSMAYCLIRVHVPDGCVYMPVHARYNAALGCYIFLKMQPREVLR